MKRLVVIFGLLLIFGCSSNGNRIESQDSFGYFGSAFSGFGTGDYITELSNSSNIATIAPPNNDPENADYVIDLVIKAQNHGMKSILWVDHLFFYIDWETSEKELYLYPDYKERWDRYASSLIAYIDSILMFYILDEPYWNGSHAQIPRLEMKEMLEIVALTIQNTFPDVGVGSCFAAPSIDEDFEIPKNYTLVGFDYYLANQNMELYFEKYNHYLDIFISKMYPHQRLFLVPGGFQNANNLPSQDDLALIAEFFYDVFLYEYEIADFMVVFLYPSISGLIGLEDLPQLMEKYKEIGRYIVE